MLFKAAIVQIGTAAILCITMGSPAAEPPIELTKAIDFEKPVERPLHEVIDLLSNTYGLKIEVDKEAFAAEKREFPNDIKAWLPRFPSMHLETALRFALAPADAVFEIRGKTIVIVPNQKQGKAVSFPPHSQAGSQRHKDLLARMAKTVEMERDVEAPLKDVLEFLQDRFDFTVVLTPAQARRLGESRVKIDKGEFTVGDILKQTLKQVKSSYLVEPDYIRVVPRQES